MVGGVTNVEGATIPGLLDDLAESSQVDALVFPGERVSYGEYAERTIAAAW